MPLEVELKFPVVDLVGFAERVEQIGGELREKVRQVDTYYAHPARDFAQTDEALRIRRVGGENYITYKGPRVDQETKTRREIELELAAGDAGCDSWRALLEALGFSEVFVVAKSRTPYELVVEGARVEIALDQVDRLGDYVEIETAAEASDLESARGLVSNLAAQLGLQNPERRSYLELLLAAESPGG